MAFYNTKNYSYLLKQDCSVVITGDSLAYNRYDFVDEPRMNAWECPFAMESWSFLLRNYLVTHSLGWQPAVNVYSNREKTETEQIKYSILKGHDKALPLEEQVPVDAVQLESIKDNSLLRLDNCSEYICCISESDVEKAVLPETAGNPELFGGSYFKWIKSGPYAEFTMNKGSRLIIAGSADVKTDVHMTGSGSKTGEWLLENFDERIVRYNPDLTIMIIGANNRREKNPESFRKALNEIIAGLKREGSEIILLSPPHSSTTDPAWGDKYHYEYDKDITGPILKHLREAASEHNLVYVDLFEFFRGVPNDKWRFDNTHFTKEGNRMLFEALRNNLFTEV